MVWTLGVHGPATQHLAPSSSGRWVIFLLVPVTLCLAKSITSVRGRWVMAFSKEFFLFSIVSTANRNENMRKLFRPSLCSSPLFNFGVLCVAGNETVRA